MFKALPIRLKSKGAAAPQAGANGHAHANGHAQPSAPSEDDPHAIGAEGWLTAFHIKKSYRKRMVVKGVSLAVGRGESVGLLGPNGAGKTTVFYMITGLVAADDGRITIDGENVTSLPMYQRARLGVGYLPQEASVFRKLSVADNVMAILETRPELDRAGREERLEQILGELRITHVRDSLGMSLSGGERRRVEIARALVLSPSFILLDEPFAGIDPIAVLDIQGIIRHLRQMGIGILITDHNVRETLKITDRAYIINNGGILRAGSPLELSSDPQVRKIYLGEQFEL